MSEGTANESAALLIMARFLDYARNDIGVGLYGKAPRRKSAGRIEVFVSAVKGYAILYQPCKAGYVE